LQHWKFRNQDVYLGGEIGEMPFEKNKEFEAKCTIAGIAARTAGILSLTGYT